MSKLGIILITKNESKNIKNCLESVKFADEIIIFDSGSTDNTIEIAKAYTTNIYQTDWPGFGIQKNRALDACECEWVFAIDADEIVPPKLWQEIISLIQNNPVHSAYEIKRKSKYCQQDISFGDWKNDICIRLFKKGSARFKELPVHESLVVTGTVGRLKEILIHHSFPNLEEVLAKLNSYSTYGAEYKFQQGKQGGLFKAISHGIWTFFRGYILRLGFLDGKKGLMLAVSNAEGCYYRYLKMMLLQEKTDQSSLP